MDAPDKKHPCPDCRQCQWCSEDRCRLCLRSSSSCRKKLSMDEQIALFESINRTDSQDPADSVQKTSAVKQQS